MSSPAIACTAGVSITSTHPAEIDVPPGEDHPDTSRAAIGGSLDPTIADERQETGECRSS